ncbi:MAG: DUF3866 family protein [Coriobacteriia bacterium]|nr:DUF3866 family protein [Coriobacteriia bacterium]
MRAVWGTVVEVAEQREGLQRLVVTLDDGSAGVAVCYTALSGAVAAGERVVLNTTAVDLALGTGGIHFVVARAGSDTPSPTGAVVDRPSAGHIMKLRYTPMQLGVLCDEAQESQYHERLASAVDVDGMPVVCCGLHSQIPLVAAAIKHEAPSARLAYVMTDGAALPFALSDLVPACVAAGLLDTCVTCGQAFGGEHEAVTVHSGLLIARHVAACDAAIVAIGPGVVGTGTPFGHGGVAQGEALNAAASVGGVPVAVLRLSFADERPRHRGVSHHSITALGRVALAPSRVAVPALPPEQAALLEGALADARVWERHVRADVEPRPLPNMRGVRVRTMGRGPDDDPAFFSAAAAGGTVAGRILS